MVRLSAAVSARLKVWAVRLSPALKIPVPERFREPELAANNWVKLSEPVGTARPSLPANITLLAACAPLMLTVNWVV